MNYLVDSYTAYMVDGGLLDKGSQVVNWMFVELPFFLLRMGATFFLICENVMNQSDYFAGKQQEAYDYSVKIINGFGGKGVVAGSLIGLGITLSAFYLLYCYFSKTKNFSKSLLHYIGVIALFGLWFGSVTTVDPETKQETKHTGAIFLIDSVSEITKEVQSKFTASANFGTTQGEEKDGVYQSPMFDATVNQTFNYVNSGSLDGKMQNGKKIDYNKLLEKPDLSKDEKEKFERKRNDYVEGLEKENPYFKQDTAKTLEKSFAVWTGIANLQLLAFPVMYINVMLSVIQLIVVVLILFFPVIVLASFFPKCQMVLFKFLKALFGVLFLPIVFGIFLSVLFWVNKLIDGAFLGLAGKINGSLLEVLSGGFVYLIAGIASVVVKLIFLRKLWKNRYAILAYFSDHQIEQPKLEKQLNEKTKEVAQRTGEVGVGAAETGVGAFTGNISLVLDGVGRINPQIDKALNLGRDHFVDENGQFAGMKAGLNSLLNKNDEEEELPELETPKENEVFEEVEEQPVEEELQENENPVFEGELFEEKDSSVEELDTPFYHDNEEVQEENENDFSFDIDPVVEKEMEQLENEQPLQEDEKEKLADNLTVTVDNFDELAFAREEKAYFDQEENSELLATYSGETMNNVHSFTKSQEYYDSLEETEKEFFGSTIREEDNEYIEGW
ncbi:hypothetical protein P4507_001517 [Enterococcus faecalis]|nr:hypothetical protein [Enterococcus faecalis]